MELTRSNSGTLKFGTSANQTGVISGAGALTKTGLKQLVLSGDNSSMSGAVTVVAGTIQLGHASAFGDGTNTVTVESGANVGKSISNNFEIAGTNLSVTPPQVSIRITLQATNLIKSSGDLTFGGTIQGTSGVF